MADELIGEAALDHRRFRIVGGLGDREGKSYEAGCDGFMSAACQSPAGQKPVIGP